MRNGDFSELLRPNNVFFSAPQIIRDPTTGQPFPGNVIPANRLSPNGLALLSAYPQPTPGFRSGTQQRDHQQREPAGPAQGQLPRSTTG